MSKPRILIIENSPAITGALKSIVISSKGCSDRFEFIFLLPRKSTGIAFVREQGFEVHTLAMVEIRKSVFSLVAYFPALILNAIRLAAIVRRFNVSLIVNNDFYNLIPPVYRLLGGHIPYVCYVRFLPSKFPAPLVRMWTSLHAKHARAIIAVSEAVKRELPVKENVQVIYNELPTENILYSSPPRGVLLYCANYIPGKGQEYALQSFARIAKQFPGWTLRFVGGDMGLEKNRDYKNQLVAQCKKLDLTGCVEFRDFEQDPSGLYLASSLVLNFSESESFSMTCLEAMFYGRPVIATKSGGPQEIIEHERTGLLVTLGDVDEMAQALTLLMQDAALRGKLAENAYESVRQRFSFENTIGKLCALYVAAMANKK